MNFKLNFSLDFARATPQTLGFGYSSTFIRNSRASVNIIRSAVSAERNQAYKKGFPVTQGGISSSAAVGQQDARGLFLILSCLPACPAHTTEQQKLSPP